MLTLVWVFTIQIYLSWHFLLCLCWYGCGKYVLEYYNFISLLSTNNIRSPKCSTDDWHSMTRSYNIPLFHYYINVREYRNGNQKWPIMRNRQHRAHKMKTNKTKTQHLWFRRFCNEPELRQMSIFNIILFYLHYLQHRCIIII